MFWVSGQVVESNNLCIVLIALVRLPILALTYTAVFPYLWQQDVGNHMRSGPKPAITINESDITFFYLILQLCICELLIQLVTLEECNNYRVLLPLEIV